MPQYNTIRPSHLAIAKALLSGLFVAAAPTPIHPRGHAHDEDDSEGSALWILYVVSMVLVLLGGAFAGLTIALMGQDGIYLQVISRDIEEPQRKNAKRVYDLLNKGKHVSNLWRGLLPAFRNQMLPPINRPRKE
jgi:metal transporter CNNM